MAPVNAPTPMTTGQGGEKMRYRSAAFRAAQVFPGPVGELACREILAWEEFGYSGGVDGLIARLVKQVEDTPIPPPERRP